MKLFYKLLLVFLVIAVLPVIVITYFSYTSSRSSVERDIDNLLQTTTVLKEEQFNQWLVNNQQMLLQISTTPSLIDTVAAMTRVEPDGMVFEAYRLTLLQEHLTPLLVNQSGFLDYIVIGVPDGLILAATDPSLDGQYRGNESFFLEGQKGAYIDSVRNVINEGGTALHISIPIWDHSGELLAVLVGHANPEEMSRIMRLKTNLAETQETYLVNQSSIFVTEPMFGDNFAQRKAIQTEGVDRCLEGNSGFGSYPDYRGVDVIGYHNWIPEREMCILTEIDQSEAFAPIIALRNRIVLYGLIAIAVVVLLAGIFTDTLTRPIHMLVEGVEEIGKGHLEHHILVNTGDEIEQLADAFNEMSVNLDRNVKQVEYNRRQVLALSQAAQVVQRALGPDQIYETMGAEVGKLGLEVVVFRLGEIGWELTIPYTSLKSNSLKEFEELIGVEVRAYRGEILEEGFLHQVMTSGKALFVNPVKAIFAEVFPGIAGGDIARMVESLKIREAILSPLVVQNRIWGILMILGNELHENDIPAIDIFANQTAVALENVQLLQNLQSERNFINAVLETTSALMVVLDAEGRIIRFNHTCEEITGYTFEEMRGAIIWEILYRPEEVGLAQAKFEELFHGDSNNQHEGYWIGKDGTPYWINWSDAALQDEQGRVQYVVKTGIDITEQMLAIEELRKLSQAIEQSPSMVVILDTAGRIEYANPKFCETTGYSMREIFGKDLSLVTRWSPEEKQRVWDTLQQGNEWRGEHENFKKDGGVCWVSALIVPIKDETGNITHYLKTAEDITEQRVIKQVQTRLITIINATPDLVSTMDLDGRILNLNRAGRQFLGVAPGESLAELKVIDAYPRWAADLVTRVGIPTAIEKGFWRGETALVDLQGHEMPASQVILAHYDLDNKVAYLSTIIRDITEQKLFELELQAARDELERRVLERTASLKESEERYRSLSEAAPDMVFTVDQDYCVRYVNSYAAQQLGQDIENLIEKSLDDLFPLKISMRLRQSIQKVITTGEKIFLENQLEFSGVNRWLSTWLVPLRDSSGNIHTVMGVSRDITRRKEAEQQLEATVQNLQHSNKELEQFAYVASHDLQEPLRMVTSYLQLIERRYSTQLDENAHVYIDYAVDGANRMKILINDLLAYSRVGTRGKEFEQTDLNQVLSQVLNEYDLLIEETGAQISFETLPVVMGDAVQLAQLLRNLLGNALKFYGDDFPQIHIGVTEHDGEWLFSVHDEGIGIDPKYFDRIFVIFQRLHTREDYPGTGIGLAICKKIVERHKGKIWVESQPWEGTTFYFTLPKKIVEGESHGSL